MRRIVTLLCALVLTACQPVPWYLPLNDHDLQCVGGECDLGEAGGRGEL